MLGGEWREKAKERGGERNFERFLFRGTRYLYVSSEKGVVSSEGRKKKRGKYGCSGELRAFRRMCYEKNGIYAD
jgi:hypothetical protein